MKTFYSALGYALVLVFVFSCSMVNSDFGKSKFEVNPPTEFANSYIIIIENSKNDTIKTFDTSILQDSGFSDAKTSILSETNFFSVNNYKHTQH